MDDHDGKACVMRTSAHVAIPFSPVCCTMSSNAAAANHSRVDVLDVPTALCWVAICVHAASYAASPLSYAPFSPQGYPLLRD